MRSEMGGGKDATDKSEVESLGYARPPFSLRGFPFVVRPRPYDAGEPRPGRTALVWHPYRATQNRTVPGLG